MKQSDLITTMLTHVSDVPGVCDTIKSACSPYSGLPYDRTLTSSQMKQRLKDPNFPKRERLPVAVDEAHDFITIVCTGCFHMVRVPVYCGNRFCNVCCGARKKRVRNRIRWLIANRPVVKGTMLKLLTLTLRSEPDLQQMVKHLLKSFRRLRQRAYFKKTFIGGAFVVELKRGKHGWHAHIHAVVQAYLVDWERLRDLWKECSRGSTGVDIRNRSAHTCAWYITKYITKSDLSEGDQVLASAALKGCRLFNPFGAWYAVNKEYVAPEVPCPKCGETGNYLPWDIIFGDWKG
ncbi:MAG: protein rep [Deltaproteobacteria bacterium]|nr:protein rep [Deltaproteobacteria bacterium]